MRQEHGQASVELLLILGIMLVLLFALLSLGQGYAGKHALAQGTAVAARQIALTPDAWGTALAGVQDAVDHALLGGLGSVTCTVQDTAGALVDPTLLPFGTPFIVTCTVPFQPDIPFQANALRTLTAQYYEVMERYP